jgi:hypothetical protein
VGEGESEVRFYFPWGGLPISAVHLTHGHDGEGKANSHGTAQTDYSDICAFIGTLWKDVSDVARSPNSLCSRRNRL